MTGPRSVEERISLWLEGEAVGQLPDHTLDATFERTRAIRRRPGLSTWRPFPMSRPLSTVIAAGAAVIAIVIGASLLRPSAQPSVVGTTPSVSASAGATAEPTARPKPYGLAIVNLDGSVRQELGLPPDAWTADLSADGTKVAFTTVSPDVGICGACASGDRRLAVVRVGRQVGDFVNLGDVADLEPGKTQQPVWSPDGSKLAFAGMRADGNVDIYVADLGTSTAGGYNPTVQRLTTDPAIDEFPAWAPDGKTILYDNLGADGPDDSGFALTQEIWSVPAAGGKPVRLTNNSTGDTQPDIAADGTVAFWSDGDIWTMALDGSDQRRLTIVPSGLGFNPRWSPDRSKIALLEYDPRERARLDLSMQLPVDHPLLKVVVVDLSTGAMTDVGPRVPNDVNPVSWTADGAALLVYRYDQPN
jgi:Tol biopolymer transport system component